MSNDTTGRRGLMLVLSSPSGAGKTTLSRRLLQSDPDIVMSVSATTRAPRPNEIDGQDYFFVTPEKFDAMVADGEFLEHANVFGHKYGTPRTPVSATRKRSSLWRSSCSTRRRSVMSRTIPWTCPLGSLLPVTSPGK